MKRKKAYNNNRAWKKAAAAVWLLVLLEACLLVCGCSKKDALYLETEAKAQTDEVQGAAGQAEISGTAAGSAEDALEAASDTGEQGDAAAANDTAGMCFVYVCGAVKNPGVYQVPEGSRVFEVIEQAGGLTEAAVWNGINQAQVVSDGQMIEVLTEEEQQEEQAEEATAGQGLVNINTASAAELMTLNGIGEAKAAAITEYRETNGYFESIQDIMKVSGIGEGLFAKIRDKITV